MTLTQEQFQSAVGGQTLRFHQDGVEFVVLQAKTLEYAEDVLQMRSILARAFDRIGWNEPGMEAYDNYPVEK